MICGTLLKNKTKSKEKPMKKLSLLALLIAPLALSACSYMPSMGDKSCCGNCSGGECSMKHAPKADNFNT